MEAVAKKYKDRAEFVFVYCREAHPEGDKRFKTVTKKGEPIKQATTGAEREETARQFCQDMKLTRRILVDEFGNDSVQRLYGGRPNPTVVIGVDGKVALKVAWTNGRELDRFLSAFLAGGGKLNLDLAARVSQGGPGAPKDDVLTQTVERTLAGLDLTEAEAALARAVLVKKMQARGRLRQEALALEELSRDGKRGEAELAKAVERFEAAVAEYQRTAAELDRELRAAVSVAARARLLAAGVLENGFGFGPQGPGKGGDPKRPPK